MFSLLQLILFVVAFAALNRSAGADRWWKGNGRNIYYVIPLAALATFLFTGGHVVWAITVAIAWAVYRLPGWYSLNDMGRNNPEYWTDPESSVARDFTLMALRQSWYGIPLAVVGHFHGVPIFIGLPLVLLTGLLGAYGYLIGHYAWLRNNSTNPTVVAEIAAGAFLGLVTWVFVI